MKTLIKRSFFVGMATLGITTLHAQTADEIVNKYIDAIGGRTVISGVKSLIVESTVLVMGQEAPSTTYILAGKGFRTETDFSGQKMVQSVNPTGGWVIMPPSGTATAIPADQAKASQSQMEIGGPLVDAAAKGIKVELIGKDSADYKLKMAGGPATITFFINTKTYLIDKLVSSSPQGETTVSFSDYRKTDFGYTVAYAQALDLPQLSLNITNKKVTVNAPIDPAIFD